VSNEILNPDSICEDCNMEYTSEGEWIMDVYCCPNQQEYCLNCCGCDEHKDEPSFDWPLREAIKATIIMDKKWFEAVAEFTSYWEPGEIMDFIDVETVKVDKDGALVED
jgi:hypothetical protein